MLMRENGSAWTWTEARQKAALLLAEDELTDVEIAAEVDTSPSTLDRWKHAPEFMGRVEEIARELAEVSRKHAIARRARRIAELQRRHTKLLAVIEARAADPSHRQLPGGETGLMVRKVKVLGHGAEAREVIECQVDVGTLKELREIEKQVAQELGQWTERREVTDKRKDPEDVKHLSDEELERIARQGLNE